MLEAVDDLAAAAECQHGRATSEAMSDALNECGVWLELLKRFEPDEERVSL